jgi:hypothetical protein
MCSFLRGTGTVIQQFLGKGIRERKKEKRSGTYPVVSYSAAALIFVVIYLFF